MRRAALMGTVVMLAAFARPAAALPGVGATQPDLTLVDGWDRTLVVDRSANKPILVVYEDKDSATQNQPLKDELARLAEGDRYKDAIALLAVADVEGYAYWPIRGFVKDAIQSESAKFKTTIYCDWNGGVRGKLGLKKGASSILLYGRDGRLLLSHEGPMPAEKRKALVDMLKTEVSEYSPGG